MIAKWIQYIKETKAEMKYVRWLNKKEVVNFTLLVIAVSLAVAVFLGFFDIIFSYLIKKFII